MPGPGGPERTKFFDCAPIPPMPIHLIYARSRDFCIGQGGGLPWRLPRDFRHFKETTLGHPVLMGRRTYEDHKSLLPQRTNVVLTRDRSFVGVEGLVIRHDLEAALDEFTAGGQLAFVIGGAGLYAAAFPRASAVVETVVDTEVPDGDVRVPAFDFAGWDSERILAASPDDRHAFGFEVRVHRRPAAGAPGPASEPS